jgi:hypothetical protein
LTRRSAVSRSTARRVRSEVTTSPPAGAARASGRSCPS